MKLKFILIIIFTSQLLFSQKNKLNISIDERIETLYSIAYFNNYFLVSNHDNIYKKTLDKKLSSLKNHRAVSLFDSISKNYNFSYYRPVEWILQYSDFPEFEKTKQKFDKDDETITKGKEHLLDEFTKELINFNQDSLYQKYITITKPINEKIIQNILESKSIQFLPDYLEEFYGTRLSSYNLIISPLLHSGGFNSEIINQKGEKEVYAIIGPNGEIDFYPYFDQDYLEMDMILHEFGHSFLNPLTDKYKIDIEKLKSKYYNNILEKNGEKQGYSNWKDVFNEILLRTIVINITRNKFGDKKADELINYEKSIGFDLVEKFSKELNYYQNNRNRYKTFESFYPYFLQQLK